MIRIIRGAFSDVQCDELIEHFNTNKSEESRYVSEASKGKQKFDKDTKIAKSRVLDLPIESEYNKVTWDIAKMFCKDYDYTINGQTGLRMFKYEEGGHFVWHTDAQNGLDVDQVTITIQLSKPEDYDGGNFLFGSLDGNAHIVDYADMEWGSERLERDMKINHTLTKERGTVCIYDSRNWHKVTPVTRGCRYGMINWFSDRGGFLNL